MRRLIVLTATLASLAAFGNSAQAASSKYCLIESGSGAKDCGYASRAQCMKSKGDPSDTCVLNNGNSSGKAKR